MKTKTLMMVFISMLLLWQNDANAQAVANKQPESSQFAAVRIAVAAKNNQTTVKLVNAKLLNGVYKNQNDAPEKAGVNDLVFYVLNDKGEQDETIVINDPLHARVEYPAGDHQTIQSATVNKTEDEILLRFSYSKGMNSILVKKMNVEHQLITLTTIPLNFK